MDSFPAAAAVAPWHYVRIHLMPPGSLNTNEHCLFLVNFSGELAGRKYGRSVCELRCLALGLMRGGARNGLVRVSFDDDIDVGVLFQFHLMTVFILETIVDANFPV